MLISRSVAVEQPALLDQGQTIGNLLETEESRIEIDSKAAIQRPTTKGRSTSKPVGPLLCMPPTYPDIPMLEPLPFLCAIGIIRPSKTHPRSPL